MRLNLNIIIADDEAPARKRLRTLLGDIPNTHVFAEAKNGKELLEVMNNACIFKSFFANRIGIKNMKIDGGDFYDSVRCGLLHETQTKNNWKIRKGLSDGDAYEEKDVFKIIYRDNFQRDLEILIENYKKAIINGVEFDGIPACELRENFIAKFNHICKVS